MLNKLSSEKRNVPNPLVCCLASIFIVETWQNDITSMAWSSSNQPPDINHVAENMCKGTTSNQSPHKF